MTQIGRKTLLAGALGAAFGMLAAGAAVGVAAERQLVGRTLRRGRRASELGTLRGTPTVIDVDGVQLYAEVDDVDENAGLTVVFCHGYALTLDSWHFQRKALREAPGVRRLVFYDQRGHGRSERGPRDTATIEQLGRDLAAVLAETAPDGPVLLVGHSMGGMTVMALADTQPEPFGSRIRGVALISTSPGKLAEVTLGVPAAIGRLAHRMAPPVVAALGTVPRLAEHGRRLGSAVELVLTDRYSFASPVPVEVIDWTASMIASTPVDVIAAFFPAFDAHDKLEALPVLRSVDALLLCGDSDLMTPADHTRGMAEVLPDAELVVVPDAGHMVLAEHPTIVNDALLRLVARLTGAVA